VDERNPFPPTSPVGVRPILDDVGVTAKIEDVHVRGHHVEDVDDAGGEEGSVEEESLGGGGEGRVSNLVKAVGEKAQSTDDEHRDPGREEKFGR